MSARQARVPSRFSGGLWHAYLAWRYAILFYSLLLTLAAGPLLAALGSRTKFLLFFLGMNLLAAVVPIVGKTRKLFLLVLVVVLALESGAALSDSTALSTASLTIWTVLALLAAASALRFALGATVVDREHIYAALSAYVLSGLYFGVFYWVLERAEPGSLSNTGAYAPESFSITQAIYFSFVTLTTLGYGDVVPRSEVARGLVIIQAVGGQLYLAVMIARLLSLYVDRAGRGKVP